MNSNRIEELQNGTAYPQSRSVQKALLQVWQEMYLDRQWDLQSFADYLEIRTQQNTDCNFRDFIDEYLSLTREDEIPTGGFEADNKNLPPFVD